MVLTRTNETIRDPMLSGTMVRSVTKHTEHPLQAPLMDVFAGTND